MEDRRCKLGLAGRLELVRLVEQGYSFAGGSRLVGGRAGDRAPLVASLADGV